MWYRRESLECIDVGYCVTLKVCRDKNTEKVVEELGNWGMNGGIQVTYEL